MEDLLRNDFTTHYALPACTIPDLVIQTTETYFEIEDTQAQRIVIHTAQGQGMARFNNPDALMVSIANYDRFVTSLPQGFQNGRKRCDIIICDNEKYVVLGELKDSPNIKHHRKVAKAQLLISLTTLLAVPQFLAFINGRTVKKCCYFNKQAKAPELITAVVAFNRLQTIFPDGLKRNHSDIESYDFEFWEYLGGQTLTFTK